MRVLVHLVSGQNAPNFIAAREINADVNVFLFTTTSQHQKEWLKAAIGKQSVEFEIDPFDVSQMGSVLEKCMSAYAGEDLMLNFTGGTKLMSVLSYNMFSGRGIRCIYVDGENEVIRTYDRGAEARRQQIDVNVSFVDYLRLSGHVFRRSESWKVPEQERASVRNLLSTSYHLMRGLLFKLRQDDSKRALKNEYTDGPFTLRKNSSGWNLGVDRRATSATSEAFRLSGDDAVKYLIGGWLEDLVLDQTVKSGLFGDVISGIVVEWRSLPGRSLQMAENELDVVAMRRGVPLIIECKSGVALVDHVYKLKALKELFGGTYSSAAIVTYDDSAKDVLQKAEEFAIQIVPLEKYPVFLRMFSPSPKPSL